MKRINRRRALQAGAGLALAGAVLPTEAEAAVAPVSRTSVYEALGVRPVINAIGTVTFLGGSLMPPEVAAAWVAASRQFVNLSELQDRIGEKIAQLIGVEAALVTTGAAGSLLLATSAVVTRGDRNLVRRLPDTTGMRNEVLIQKAHHSCYDNQLTNVGVRLIEVESAADVKRAVGPRTALMFFMNHADAAGSIRRRAWVNLARKYGIPSLLDAAADVPPVENLAAYNRMGFDLVAFSGGKALRGPNDTGLLLGRKEWIEAAKLNVNPNCPSIGRMMKVGKEDMVALLAAVERYVKLDHKAEWREWERRIGVIEQALREVPTVEFSRVVPPVANHVPHLQIAWGEKRVGISRAQVTRRLAEGNPPILIGRVHGTGERGILISVFVLGEGEERIVAERLRAILARAE